MQFSLLRPASSEVKMSHLPVLNTSSFERAVWWSYCGKTLAHVPPTPSEPSCSSVCQGQNHCTTFPSFFFSYFKLDISSYRILLMLLTCPFSY